MATLALGLVGAAIGSAVPAVGTIAGFIGLSGAALGFAVGSAIGSALTRPKGQNVSQEGPQIGDVSIQSSAYGLEIAQIYGSARVAGNLIWKSPTVEISNTETEDVGGKGGGGSTVSTTTFTYFSSFAIALCEGPIAGVSRVWRDGELILDFSEGADASSVLASNDFMDNFIVYTGSETQEPDPIMESFEGVGNVPGYRGIAYVIFDNFKVERSSYNFTFEVLEASDNDYIIEQIDLAPSLVFGVPTFDVYNSSDNDIGYQRVIISDTPVVVQRFRATYSGEIFENEFITINAVGGVSGTAWGSIRGSDFYTLLQSVYPSAGTGVFQFVAFQSSDLVYNSNPAPLAWIDGQPIKGANFQGCQMYKGDLYCKATETLYIENVTKFKEPYVGVADAQYIAADPVSFLYVNENGAYISTRTAIVQKIIKLDHDLNFVKEWTMPFNLVGPAINVFDELNTIVTSGNSGVFKIVALHEDTTVTEIFSGLKDPSDGQRTAIPVENVMLFGATWIGPSLSAGTRTLASVVQDRCERSGLAAADIDVSELTPDVVKGYTIGKQMTGRASIEPLMIGYLFDAVESDWKLKFKKRGSAPVVTIEHDDLGAHPMGSDQPVDLPIIIQDEDQLPMEVTTGYVDKDFDYQIGTQKAQRAVTNSDISTNLNLPIIFNEDEGRQLSEILLANRWTERFKYSPSVGMKYWYLDPSDVITVEKAASSFTMRIEKMDVGDFIPMQAVAEEIANYVSDASGQSGGTGAGTIAPTGQTECKLMNLPSLLASHIDTPTYYVAMRGVYSGWPGGSLYSSPDDATFTILTSVFASSNIGSAPSNKLDPIDPGGWDDTSVLNVSMSGDLSSISEELVIFGQNGAAYGKPGRWEILQFVNADLQLDGTYNLSRFSRARHGTEWAMSLHEDGDDFIIVSGSTTKPILYPISNIDQTNFFRCVTLDRPFETASSSTFQQSAENLMPIAPHHLHYTRSANDINSQWIRRDRLAPSMLWNVLNSEDTEEYKVEYYDSTFTTLLRTETVTSISDVYTSAEQTTDGITPGVSVGIRVYQNSAVVTTKRYAELLVPAV